VKVVWSRRALLDVEHIRDYIAQDSPAYAQPFIERLLHTTRNLPHFPQSGRLMPEADNPNILTKAIASFTASAPATSKSRWSCMAVWI
jgi:plasmid stabilization system protein ParE